MRENDANSDESAGYCNDVRAGTRNEHGAPGGLTVRRFYKAGYRLEVFFHSMRKVESSFDFSRFSTEKTFNSADLVYDF